MNNMNIGKFEELNNQEMMNVEGGFFLAFLISFITTAVAGGLTYLLVKKVG